MDLLNMANKANIHEFIRTLLEEIFIFQATDREFCDLLAVWKLATKAIFQHIFSKIMPSRSKTNTGIWVVNTTIGV